MARKPLMAGNWKMNNTYAEAVVLAQTISNNFDKHWADSVDVLVCPPSIDLKPVNTVFEFDHQPIRNRRAERVLGAEGRLHGRGIGPHAQGRPLHMLHRRPLRAPRLLRRNQRGSQPQGPCAARWRPVCRSMRRRIAVRARRGRRRGVRLRPGARRVRGLGRAEEAAKCVVAYEPIWAIGTGRTATPEQARGHMRRHPRHARRHVRRRDRR